MRPDTIFVSGVPGRDSIYRVSARDAGHKMGRYLASGDATGTLFRLRLEMLLLR
jgi:hypothetical protein